MIGSISESKAGVSEGSVLISAEFEQHCIQITDIDKRINDVKSELEHVTKSLENRNARMFFLMGKTHFTEESQTAHSEGKKIEHCRKQIEKFSTKQSDLENQLKQLEERREELIGETSETQGSDHAIRLIGGKASGVTGGAVVEIEKDGEKKQYMLKNIFDREAHKGKHYYDPNCKSETRSFFTRHTLKEVKSSVIQEFIALRLANVVSPGIAPDAILGTINDGNGKTRYCLLTEIAGKGEGETFSTLDGSANKDGTNPYNVEKKHWQSAFAIGIGLLNDKDVNKKDNIGVVKNGEGSANLSLFDLGHASPDEFKLDPETLLPKSKSKVADFALWSINLFVPANSIPGTFYFDKDIQGILTIDERKEALKNLLKKREDIMNELEKIKNDVPEGDRKIVDDMKRRIEARLDQLNDVLDAHDKISDAKIRKDENNVSHSSKQNGGGKAADASQPLAKNEKGKAGKDAGFIRSLFKKKKAKGDEVVDAARPFVRQNGGGKTTKLNKSSKRKKGNKTTDVSRSSSKRNVEGKITDVNQAFVQELKERQKKRRGQSSEQNGGGEVADVDITIEEIPD